MTEQRESILPSAEQVRDEQTMKIITVSTLDLARKFVETTLDISSRKGDIIIPLCATLVKFEDDRIKEYMPSKVWYDPTSNMDNFNVLFYVNTSMPQKVRPFKENTYLMFFIPKKDDVIEYDCNIRLFMDQVLTKDGKMAYVIMFGEEEYDQIVVDPERKPTVTLRPDEEEILKAYQSTEKIARETSE